MKISHIAFIPDGNRRWARLHGFSVIKGHEKGIDKMGEVLQWCQKEGIKTISFWAFSTENFNRDKQEVELLFKAFKNRLKKVLEEAKFEKSKTAVKFIGQKNLFPKDIQRGMEIIEKKTRKYSDYQLNFFIGYGGKAEIIEAVKGILKDYTKEDVDKINEEVLNRYLWSGALPEPDLIIRTSGEQRLSGFLPLKSSYSELYFCKKYWPDFNYEDFYMAITDFYKRVRRWGR